MPSEISMKKAEDIMTVHHDENDMDVYPSVEDVATALDQARQEGRREGILEAAKVAEDAVTDKDIQNMNRANTPSWIVNDMVSVSNAISKAIRNLLTEKGK